ncbi:MAG: diadenylate cyclase [Desulfobacteraceae bacterium]|jgi:uncharacterized protein (TIGR00159 family)
MDTLLSFLSSIRWQDVVDVLVNSYILFRLYVLFRGTNVIRVIAGIALLWIFQRLAAGMGLIVTSWAMQGIIAGAALIIVIVFRNEIRNVLQAKNIRAIFWGVPRRITRSSPVDSIVVGVYDLARKNTGALIVIPGKEDIDEILQGGVQWQGLVSRQMLMSIFWNGNPVHDGAAVIVGDRVTRVGAILPLSPSDELPSKYGTRHRAAVGLTEQSDALVIVVSEERGEVIAVKNSDIIPIKDNLALKGLIRSHLGIVTELDDDTQRDSMELTMAAVVCVLCMAGVWFSFARGLETLTSLEVPLEYVNRDSRMQILSASENTVRLHLSGSGALISSMKPDQVKVKVDLDNAVNGENLFTITNDNIGLPPGVRLNRIEPSEVKLVLDFPISKKLPIQVDWVGALPDGLILKSVKLKPDSVVVIGGGKILNEINTMYTERVQLDNLQASGQVTVGLAMAPASLEVAYGYKERVRITFVILKRGG